jgi:hypothetical protein
MISHIELAHQISKIHEGYSKIHSAVFTFSFEKMKLPRLQEDRGSAYFRYEQELTRLNAELAEVRTIIEAGREVDLSTTLYREFSAALSEYALALGDAVTRLSNICTHRCRQVRDLQAYSETQSRADRIAYDEAVQYYQRLGRRVERLFSLL